MKHATDVLAEYIEIGFVWLLAAAMAAAVIGLCVRLAIDIRRWLRDGCP